jgi:TetR/AcrR family transcriptional regulator
MKDFSHIDFENEKVKSIIIAALEVFSNNDYEKASTNIIVKKAGVPRGVLYYYFKSKEELFEYLIYKTQEIYISEIDEHVDLDDSDYLNRLKSIIMTKIITTSYLPFLAEFAEKVSSDTLVDEYIDYISKSKKIRKQVMEKNLDFSMLKEDVDVEMFKKMAYFSIGGELKGLIKEKGIGALRTEQNMMSDLIDKQIVFLKYHFYK